MTPPRHTAADLKVSHFSWHIPFPIKSRTVTQSCTAGRSNIRTTNAQLGTPLLMERTLPVTNRWRSYKVATRPTNTVRHLQLHDLTVPEVFARSPEDAIARVLETCPVDTEKWLAKVESCSDADIVACPSADPLSNSFYRLADDSGEGQHYKLETLRWCIYIDIEGFSHFWEFKRSKAIQALRALMDPLHQIGERTYRAEKERLFCHQFGDGFTIVNDPSDDNATLYDRPIAIASALMRHITHAGVLAAASIAEGDFADITGYYNPIFQCGTGSQGSGSGVFTTSPVMGTAMIRAVNLGKSCPSGPFLVLDHRYRDRISDCAPPPVSRESDNKKWLSIDWVRHDSKHLQRISRTSSLVIPSPECTTSSIRQYCKSYSKMRRKWSDELQQSLGIDVKSE